MCFNAQKTYDLGWFTSYHQDFSSSSFTNWGGDLVGFVDRDLAGSRNMIIHLVDEINNKHYFINFNRKRGFNEQTLEGGDTVMIVSKGNDYEPSNLLAMLDSGNQHTLHDFGGKTLNIKVNTIGEDHTLEDGVMRANVAVFIPQKLVVAPLPNIALNQPAKLSSTADNLVASNAVDGNSQSIIHSASSSGSWWIVDIESVATIQRIKIYNREEKCCKSRIHGAIVSILDENKNAVSSQTVTDKAPSIVELDFGIVDGRYVEVFLGDNFLHVGEVEIYGVLSTYGMPNIALNKPAHQSDTSPGFEALKAVDGNLQSSSHTGIDKNNFWIVDLETWTLIRKIIVHNRHDCCKERLKGATISILDYDKNVVARREVTADAPDSVEFNFKDVEGRYVEIKHATNFLSLSEVEVYGKLSIRGLPNLALDKPSKQSSTAPEYDASRAVDGKVGTGMHTAKLTDNWWILDLEDMATIRQIKIFNRIDNCCRNRIHGAVVSILRRENDEIAVISRTITEEAPEIIELNFYDIDARYIRISLDTNFLNFQEVEVYGTLSINGMNNLALHKPAFQSSTSEGFEASRAVDGDYGSITHTKFEGNNWWRVDLETIVLIRKIKVYNRRDSCCKGRIHGAVVSILDENMNVVANQNINELTPEMSEFNFPDIEGRYVSVFHEINFLSIGEVEVYGYLSALGIPNLALNKPTQQSTEAGGYESLYAVDGNRETTIHSLETSGNLWKVDLEEVCLIRLIKVYNKQGCCKNRIQGAVVKIISNSGEVVATETIEEEQPEVVQFHFPDIRGQYVVVSQDNAYLNIAEVEVYGEIMNQRASAIGSLIE